MMSHRELIDQAVEARNELAHAPYSEFKVGAALRTGGGVVFQAGNVELKPSTNGMHAEQRAVGNALEAGHSGATDVAIALSADQPPCGSCLQALSTIEPDLEMDVFVYNTGTDSVGEYHLSELLPEAYTPDVRHNE